MRECTICGCLHLSDEIERLRADKKELVVMLIEARVAVPQHLWPETSPTTTPMGDET